MKYFITGGAGFIGSHLVDELIKNNKVVVYDNLSSGRIEFIRPHLKKKNFKFIKGDLLDKKLLEKSIKGADFVFHLAANPDINRSSKNPEIDFKQGTIATFNLLEVVSKNKIKKIALASSSAVAGEPTKDLVSENYGPLIPISSYGASKLACEGMLTAYGHLYDLKVWIFRFANVAGPRLTHGVIFNFIKRLRMDSSKLEIMMDGTQEKSYIYVKDIVRAMLFCIKNSNNNVNIFNLGTGDSIKLNKIAKILLKEMGLTKTKLVYLGGERGWKGDVPKIGLDATKVKKLGWKSKYSSQQAITQAIKDNL